MIKLLLSYIFIVIPFLVSAQQKVSFVEEYIDFELNNNFFKTNGLYVFANNANQQVYQNIVFPFADNTDSVEVIRILNLNSGQIINYRYIKNGIAFKIDLMPLDTININISYKQNIEKENIYILKSTASWGKALEHAKYSLTNNNSSVIDSFSYQPDSISSHVYFWSKNQFLPDKDFIIWIK